MAEVKLPLTPMAFVHAYLNMTEGQPANGHYVNAVACKKKSPRKDDSRSRCMRCDAEELVKRNKKPC